MRPAYEKANPNANKTEIDKLCKESWKALDPAEKSMFNDQAAKLSVEHAEKVCACLLIYTDHRVS
jgi:hypothetical protein